MLPVVGNEAPGSRARADEALLLFLSGESEWLRAMFDGGMEVGVSKERLDATRAAAEQGNGVLVGHGDPVHSGLRDGGDLFDYPLYYERRRAHLQVAVRQDMIAGLLLRPGRPSGRWKRSRRMLRELVSGTPPPT